MDEKRNLKFTKGRRSVWRGLGVRSKPKLQVETRIVRFNKKIEKKKNCILSAGTPSESGESPSPARRAQVRVTLLLLLTGAKALSRSDLRFYNFHGASSRRLLRHHWKMVSWKNDASLIRQMDDLSSLLLFSGYFSSFLNIWMVDDCLTRAPPHHFVKATFLLFSMLHIYE